MSSQFNLYLLYACLCIFCFVFGILMAVAQILKFSNNHNINYCNLWYA